MKRLISLVLCVIIVILFVTGCSSDNNQKSDSEICYNCGEYYVSNSNFCPMCGADLESHRIDNDDNTDHDIHIDYSNFGFENLYNMTEWIEIERCVFNDSENPYIICDGSNGHFYVMNFQNNTFHTRDFYLYDSVIYKGEFESGELVDLFDYTIVSNNLISLPDSSSYEIKELSLVKNIPIVKLKLNRGKDYTDYTVKSGNFIPVQFIDFSKEPETVEGDYGWTSIKYYIKSEYLN